MAALSRRDWLLLSLWLLGLLILLGALLAGAVLALNPELDALNREALRAAISERAALLIMLLLFYAVLLGAWLHSLLLRWPVAARQLAAQTRLISSSDPGQRLTVPDSQALGRVAESINRLAQARQALSEQLEQRVAEASARMGEERNRLAALMGQLSEGVLVCNLDGQNLLYNASSRRLLGEAGANQLGLGRSVFSLIDRNLIGYALEELRARDSDNQAPLRFVSASSEGTLLRVLIAPVQGSSAEASNWIGYVLTLHDVTGELRSGTRRLRQWRQLLETSRAGLGSIRAAVETLSQFPEMDESQRGRFVCAILDESLRLSSVLQQANADLPEHWSQHHALDTVRSEDLLASIRRHLEDQTTLRCQLQPDRQPLWLCVDSFALTRALGFLCRRLQQELGVQSLTVAVAATGSADASAPAAWANLQLQWSGSPLPVGLLGTWEQENFAEPGQDALTLAKLVERHGGDIWQQFDADAGVASVRIVLPRVDPPRAVVGDTGIGSRPEFYDFDLFKGSASSSQLDDTSLADLSYTVFDTETTGLDPSGGDEIISIGAVRIVNGRLLRFENFDQLINPGRRLTEASTRIHGITEEMLRDQPAITTALPQFHQFCQGTVLVAHNAAFDLRFLQLKEEACKLRFDHPLLDTLLLSAVAHPEQDAHDLETLAQRYGLRIVGRHTALGDAMVTAEALLKLIPELAEQGIRTLGQARAAAAKTYYARLSY